MEQLIQNFRMMEFQKKMYIKLAQQQQALILSWGWIKRTMLKSIWENANDVSDDSNSV